MFIKIEKKMDMVTVRMMMSEIKMKMTRIYLCELKTFIDCDEECNTFCDENYIRYQYIVDGTINLLVICERP